MPNFKKIAKNYERNALLALQEFVHKRSVYDATTIGPNAPYGAGVKSALDYVAKLGKDYGFAVDTCEGYCTELSFGDDNGPLIGIYAHSDVVPVSGTWRSGPFDAKIEGEGKDAKMIGRGTSDDKGPLIAALFAMKLLKDNELIKGYKVRLVSGGDEERGSSCLAHYFHKLNKPDCDYGFTPDADFPLIYAEKGIFHGLLKRNIDLAPIINIDGGVVSNAVCDRIMITLPKDPKFIAHFKEEKFDGDVNDLGEIMFVTYKGKSAHGSMPQMGINAAAIAFMDLGIFYKNEFLANLGKVIKEPNGACFGGNMPSPELGDCTYNYGLIKYDSKHELSVSLDFRYGESAKPEELVKKLEAAVQMSLVETSNLDVLLYDKKSPLVSTLMKSYKRMTLHLFDKPMAIGGGTYAKEAKNCVAYGSAFKEHPGDIHSPNEYIYLDDLYKQIAIYADAIYSLGQLKK